MSTGHNYRSYGANTNIYMYFDKNYLQTLAHFVAQCYALLQCENSLECNSAHTFSDCFILLLYFVLTTFPYISMEYNASMCVCITINSQNFSAPIENGMRM